MATTNCSETPASISRLVGDIVDDAQHLIRQELMLARREIQGEISKAKIAAISLAAGAVVALIGVILFAFMFVYLIDWASGGAIPLWGSFAIFGGVFLAVGLVMVFVAQSKASEIRLVPRQTAETLRENVQWIKNQT